MFGKSVFSFAFKSFSCSCRAHLKSDRIYKSFSRSYAVATSTDVYDVVVSGGGMVGATMAATLGEVMVNLS